MRLVLIALALLLAGCASLADPQDVATYRNARTGEIQRCVNPVPSVTWMYDPGTAMRAANAYADCKTALEAADYRRIESRVLPGISPEICRERIASMNASQAAFAVKVGGLSAGGLSPFGPAYWRCMEGY